MRVVVPFAAERPKTRLASVLDADERAAFARAMLRDVLASIEAAGHAPTVLATAPVECDAPVTVDERPLTEAVNDALPAGPEDDPVAVVMADLALATPAAIRRLFEPDADVVLAPGLGGGTNALVARDPAFRVDYHGASIRDHREIARAADLSLATVDSFRLAVDVDEPDDLVEVLLHAEEADETAADEGSDVSQSEAAEWLRERGFELETADGRVDVRRNTDES